MASEKFNVSVGQKTTVKISEGQTLVSKVVIGTPIRSVDQAAFNAATLNRQPPGYYLDWNNFTNVPDKAILERIEELDSTTRFGAGLKLRGNIVSEGSIVPDSDIRYNLGTPQYRWGSLYVQGQTIYIGDIALSDDGAGGLGVSQVVLDDDGNQVLGEDGVPVIGVVQTLAKGEDPSTDLTLTTQNQIVDTFKGNLHRSVKYVIQLEHDSDSRYETYEMLLTHNGSSVYMNEYGYVSTLSDDSSLGEFDATISITGDSSTISLLFTPTLTNTSFKAKKFTIDA
jgi:hypothetical protein